MYGAWGLWLGVLATVLAVWGDALVAVLVFGGAAAVAALSAGYMVVADRAGDPPRMLREASTAPPVLAAGVVLAANGLAFGLWLILIGAELIAFGVGLAIAERRRARAR
jgi:hypothetical protein